MGIPSEGNPYGIPDGLVYSFPVTVENGKVSIVSGLKVNEYYQKLIDKSTKELLDERKAVEHLLK